MNDVVGGEREQNEDEGGMKFTKLPILQFDFFPLK